MYLRNSMRNELLPSPALPSTYTQTPPLGPSRTGRTTMSADISKFSSDLKKIVTLTEKGMLELAEMGGDKGDPAFSAVVAAARKLAEANAGVWREVYSRKATAMEDEAMECVGRMEEMVKIVQGSGGGESGGDIAESK